MIEDFKKECKDPKKFAHNIYHHYLFQYTGYGILAALAILSAKVSMNMSQSMFHSTLICFLHSLIYFLLSVCYVPILYRSGHLFSSIKNHWWKYSIVAFLDFESTFIIVLSFSMTNIVYIQV